MKTISLNKPEIFSFLMQEVLGLARDWDYLLTKIPGYTTLKWACFFVYGGVAFCSVVGALVGALCFIIAIFALMMALLMPTLPIYIGMSEMDTIAMASLYCMLVVIVFIPQFFMVICLAEDRFKEMLSAMAKILWVVGRKSIPLVLATALIGGANGYIASFFFDVSPLNWALITSMASWPFIIRWMYKDGLDILSKAME